MQGLAVEAECTYNLHFVLGRVENAYQLLEACGKPPVSRPSNGRMVMKLLKYHDR